MFRQEYKYTLSSEWLNSINWGNQFGLHFFGLQTIGHKTVLEEFNY